MANKALEAIKLCTGDCSAALGGEASDKLESAAFVKLDKYRKYVAIAEVQGCASDGVITLTILQATAAAGTGSKTITTTITDTATSTNVTDLLLVTAEVDATALDTGSSFYFAGARLATDQTSGTEVAALLGYRVLGVYDPQSN